MFLRIVISLLVSLFIALPAFAAPVVLKSEVTGQYVGSNGSGLLTANASFTNALRFEVITLNGSQVAFQASDGQFLRAGVGAGTNLMVSSPHIRGWETFQQIAARGDSLAFMSAQNGLYVSVDNTGLLAATADRITSSAMFQILPATLVRIPLPRPSPEQPSEDDVAYYAGAWSIVQIANANGNLVSLTRDAARAVQFRIDANGQLGFTAGCNNHGGRMTLTWPQVRISDIIGTKRLCQGFSSPLESQITAALTNARFFLGGTGEDIYFLDGSSREVLILRRN